MSVVDKEEEPAVPPSAQLGIVQYFQDYPEYPVTRSVRWVPDLALPPEANRG